MKTKLLSILIGLFIVVGGLSLTVKNSEATFNPCQYLPWLCQSPSPSPSPSPSASPEVSPSVEPSPIPCEQTEEGCEVYCDDEGALNYKEEGPCLYPTPSPTPIVETSTPSYNPPTCNGIPAGIPAWVHVDRVDADSIWLNWVNGNDTERTTILYGLVGYGLDYSVLDLSRDVNELTINDLQPNAHYNVQVLNWRGECVTGGPVIDP